jgi:ATP-dependent exoDNAse (exonuclease V) alpha subunit
VILVVDPQQLQPIGAGASFRAILERTGYAEINHIYRQQQEWQRQATMDLASGKIKARK